MMKENGPKHDLLESIAPVDVFHTIKQNTGEGIPEEKLDAGVIDPKFAPAGWNEHTSDTLSEHVIEEHLHPATIAYFGFPRHDIELAKHKGLDLSAVAKTVYQPLEEGDAALQDRINGALLSERLSVEKYKVALFHTLKYLESFAALPIDWERANKYMPSIWDGTVIADRDSSDEPFNP